MALEHLKQRVTRMHSSTREQEILHHKQQLEKLCHQREKEVLHILDELQRYADGDIAIGIANILDDQDFYEFSEW